MVLNLDNIIWIFVVFLNFETNNLSCQTIVDTGVSMGSTRLVLQEVSNCLVTTTSQERDVNLWHHLEELLRGKSYFGFKNVGLIGLQKVISFQISSLLLPWFVERRNLIDILNLDNGTWVDSKRDLNGSLQSSYGYKM